MDTDTAKVSAKIATLNVSLDELEAKLEPLLAQSLPETVVGLEKLQQAKLQVVLPYLVYDLIFIYLKTRGIDPKTHPVITELDRVRQYFNKIKDAEDPAKRKVEVDKGAANRFIKHAIAQVKLGRPPGENDAQPGSSREVHVPVPVKVTSKMLAREEHQRQLREQGSEEEEDELEVFDEDAGEQASVPSSSAEGKGKQRATQEMTPAATSGKKRRRPTIDPFAGYGDEPSTEEPPAKSSRTTPTTSNPASDAGTPIETGVSTPGSDTASAAKAKAKAARKARKKARKVAT